MSIALDLQYAYVKELEDFFQKKMDFVFKLHKSSSKHMKDCICTHISMYQEKKL